MKIARAFAALGLLLLAGLSFGQAPNIESKLPTESGICGQAGVPCFNDAMWVAETLSCSGSPATVSGITGNGERLTLSPYGDGATHAVITGCGAATAQSVIGGIPVAAAGSGYVTSAQPTSGADLIVITGGTLVNPSGFADTGTIDSNGVLTVTSSAGPVTLGQVVTGTGIGNAVIVRDFIGGPTATTPPTGGLGTYQTTYVAAAPGPIVTIAASTQTTIPTANGTYTGIALTTSGAGTGAQGSITVSACATVCVYSSLVITSPGSNYSSGDTVSFSAGGGTGSAKITAVLSIQSETITGFNRTVVRVLGVSAGGVTYAGIVGGGQYTTPPGTLVSGTTYTVSQLVTTGSGTGAQFTVTYAGLPLSGIVATINSDSSFTFATGVNAITAVSSKTEQLSMGHLNDAASTATLATLPVALTFQQGKKGTWVNTPLGYGFLSPIVLPNSYRFSVLCQGARIIALGPMNAQMTVAFNSNSALFYKSIIDNCDMQGMGVVNYNHYNSAARFTVQNGSAENAMIENLYVGDGAGDNAANNEINGERVHNDSNAVPSWPAWNYEDNNSADNVVNFANMDTAMWGGMLIGGADDQVRNTHVFAYGAGPCFDVEASKTGIDGICDNMAPGQAGYFLNSTIANIHDGWQCSINAWQGQYCVYVNIDQRDTIGCGTGANNAQWAGNYANLLVFNFTYSAASTTRALPCSGNAGSDPPVQQGATWIHGNAVIDGSLSVAGSNNITAGAPILQTGIGFGVPATTVWDTAGNWLIGANPANSAAVTFSGTSGAVTATFNVSGTPTAALNGGSTLTIPNDLNRVIAVLDTTNKICTITGNSGASTSVAQCTLSGTLSTTTFSNASTWISGSATQAQSTGGGVTYPAALPLATVPPGAFLYFSGTAAGPPQGVYWCLLASAAHGQCFAQTYSTANGTLTGATKPAIPGSTSALTTANGINVPTTATPIVMAQGTLPANTLGFNGCLDYDATEVNTSSANSKALAVRLNTSGPNNPMTTQPVERIKVKMCNSNGSTSTQSALMEGTGGATGNMQVPTALTGVSTPGVVTTTPQQASFSVSMADAHDSSFLLQQIIKATPGP